MSYVLWYQPILFEGMEGLIIHPSPVQYDLGSSDTEWPLGCGMFFAIKFDDTKVQVGHKFDVKPAVEKFADAINQWSQKYRYTGQFLLRVTRIKACELPHHVIEALTARKH